MKHAPVPAAVAAVLLLAACSNGVDPKVEKRKWVQASTELMVIGACMIEFERDHGRAPGSLDELVHRPAWVKSWPSSGYYQGTLTDPWGRRYIYVPADPAKLQHRPKVISLGRDGKPGGTDLDSDIGG